MKHAFLFVLTAFFFYPAFAQHWQGDLNNKQLKGNVRSVVSRYVSFDTKGDGELALVQTYRYNEQGLLTERIFDFPGKSAFMSLKWVYCYDAAGRLITSQLYHTRAQDGSEKLQLQRTDYSTYNSDGKEIASISLNEKGDTVSRVRNEYDEQGFLKRHVTGGEYYVETLYKNDERGNVIQTISSGIKCTFAYDNNNRITEQRWHDGVTDRVYQRQTSRYEEGRLVEKIMLTKDGRAETVYTIKYENFDASGNYTRELGYNHGKLTMTHEYAISYH